MSRNNEVTSRQLERYPKYLVYLKKLQKNGINKISTRQLADEFNCSVDNVRKDFRAINLSTGKPNTNRDVDELINCLENFLGYNDNKNAILVGVGDLGKAFLKYKGFGKYGLNILAGFDVDKKVIGKTINGKVIYHIDKIAEYVANHPVKIAIMSVPSEVAQDVCNILVKSGIKGIWNFVQVHLDVSDDIVVENVDLAASLSFLSYNLLQR